MDVTDRFFGQLNYALAIEPGLGKPLGGFLQRIAWVEKQESKNLLAVPRREKEQHFAALIA